MISPEHYRTAHIPQDAAKPLACNACGQVYWRNCRGSHRGYACWQQGCAGQLGLIDDAGLVDVVIAAWLLGGHEAVEALGKVPL